MFQRVSFGSWKIAAALALPLLLATFGIWWMTFDLLDRVSTGANDANYAHTQQVVKSAFSAEEQRIATIATDNANWDAAARVVYADKIDESWLEETWGQLTGEGVYDVFFVFDPSQQNFLFGSKYQKPFSPNPEDYFKSHLRTLVGKLPQDASESKSIGMLLDTADGFAIVAAANIAPTSDDLGLKPDHARFIVFVRLLTADKLAALAEQYVVKDLELRAADQASGKAMPLLSDGPGGERVAAATWTDTRPGDAVKAKVLKNTWAALMFLALVMAGVGILCVALFRGLASRAAKARHDALHDALTGLPNRLALSKKIEEIGKSGTEDVALAFIDLDGFKEVNDTYDHETGDDLIKAIAAGLRHLAASDKMVVRLGGDEFVALLHGPLAMARAELFASQVISLLGPSFDINGKHAQVGASIGIVGSVSGQLGFAELMRRADVAMYNAKNQGKNRFCIYNDKIDEDRRDKKAIAEKLRAFIAEGRIGLAYQPIIDSSRKSIVAVEALARWPKDESPVIGPDRFIAVAEQEGLMDALGMLIMRNACTEAANWPDLRLSINVSPVQLRNPDLVRNTLQTLKDTGLPPNRLEIEITENVLVEDTDRANQVFNALRAAGVTIALDDFGSGYSSLAYLQKLRFDRIKIDRSISSKIVLGQQEQRVANSIVHLATTFADIVVAEGIESEEQGSLLFLAGCRELQGYHYHRPMSIEQLLNIRAGQQRNAA